MKSGGRQRVNRCDRVWALARALCKISAPPARVTVGYIRESTVGFLFGYKTEPIRNFKLTLHPTPRSLNIAESSR